MYAKIPVKNMSREECLKLRKTGIGDSDAGSICGMNPYSNAMKVYRDKICDTVEEQDNEAIRQGVTWKSMLCSISWRKGARF